MSIEAAGILGQAIALPNPCRREIPPEFKLPPVSPRPRSRKFSFARLSSGGSGGDVPRPINATQKQLTVTEEIEGFDEKPKGETLTTAVLPDIPPTTPLSAGFTNTVPSTESSSIVVVEPPTDIPQPESLPPYPRRKVEKLKMNDCEVTDQILELLLSAIADGGVRYWDIGANKFGVDGMKMIAGLFAEPKRCDAKPSEQNPETEQQEPGRSSPTPVSSISSVSVSCPSAVTEEHPPPEEPLPSYSRSKLEYLSLDGMDLSSHQLDPLIEVWTNHPDPDSLSLCALDLTNCRLGRDLGVLADLFTALARFPNLKWLVFKQNPLFANPGMVKVLRDWLIRLPNLRRLDLSSTGLEAQHLVEFAHSLPQLKSLATFNITNNPIYEMNDFEHHSEGQTDDLSGLTALEAAMRYCRSIIEVDLPEGGGDEAARLRHKIFLRCFKNIENLVLSPSTFCLLIFQDCATYPNVIDDPSDSTLGGRKRTTAEEAKELAQQPAREYRDKYEVDRGHGVARALETVLLNTHRDDKAQDMSLVQSPI
jgi:hypothetical protein